MNVCISPTDPALLPDTKTPGPDPKNPYRLYMQAPTVQKDNDGNDIKIVRPYMMLHCPVRKGPIGYHDLTRGVSHVFCLGDVVVDSDSNRCRFVPQQLGSDFEGIVKELKPSALLYAGCYCNDRNSSWIYMDLFFYVFLRQNVLEEPVPHVGHEWWSPSIYKNGSPPL